MIVLAFFGPPSRNANFMLATAIALAITIPISALIPAVGAGYAFGYETMATKAILTLRDGQFTGLPYSGIICFPSFHSAMAVLFTLAYRGIRSALIPAAILNGFMLLSIPFSGDHYLIDLFGGVVVALFAQWLAKLADRKAGVAASSNLQ